MAGIEPLPEPWRETVLSVLKGGDPKKIEWTLTARQDSQAIGLGMQFEALEYLTNLFQVPGLLCLPYPGMDGGSASEIRAVLGPHPAHVQTPVYVKIGIKLNGDAIKIISLHVDRTGDMERLMNRRKK
jgi:hypothetical protein